MRELLIIGGVIVVPALVRTAFRRLNRSADQSMLVYYMHSKGMRPEQIADVLRAEGATEKEIAALTPPQPKNVDALGLPYDRPFTPEELAAMTPEREVVAWSDAMKAAQEEETP